MDYNVDISLTKTPYLFNHIITPDTKICRYMEFDLFLQIMEGDFYVPRKYTFLDLRESGRIPMNIRFAFNEVGDDCSKVNICTQNEQDAIDRYIENLAQSKFLFTSCWSIDQGENYLMWKSYTNRIGICIHTTIDKLMNSIDYDKENYIPICSPLFYDSPNTKDSFLESIMKKDIYYQSEKEIRFYFVPKGNYSNEELGKMKNRDVERLLEEVSKNEENTYNTNPKLFPIFKRFDINGDFICSITLSPFIKKQSIRYFKKILRAQFGTIFERDTKIKESKIVIK